MGTAASAAVGGVPPRQGVGYAGAPRPSFSARCSMGRAGVVEGRPAAWVGHLLLRSIAPGASPRGSGEEGRDSYSGSPRPFVFQPLVVRRRPGDGAPPCDGAPWHRRECSEGGRASCSRGRSRPPQMPCRPSMAVFSVRREGRQWARRGPPPLRTLSAARSSANGGRELGRTAAASASAAARAAGDPAAAPAPCSRHHAT